MTDQKTDPEVEAIQTLLRVLEPLAAPARENVISYVFRRLGITAQSPFPPASSGPPSTLPGGTIAAPALAVSAVPPRDIRSFGQEKQPKTVTERLAVIAYYLEHLAPTGERRDYITSDDIKKYFVHANFPLPGNPPRIVLFHARKAGYFDQRQQGRYHLNPVGYNLVAHRLPSTSEENGRQPSKARSRSRPKRRATKKSKK